MSDALDRARRDMERLTAEYAATQAALADLQKRIDDVSTYIRMAEFYAEEGAELAGRPRGGTSGAAVRAVIDYLREVGHAVHTRPLLEMLTNAGINIGGANPVANLSGFLSRSEELVNNRSHGWALSEWNGEPHAPAPFISGHGDAVRNYRVVVGRDGTKVMVGRPSLRAMMTHVEWPTGTANQVPEPGPNDDPGQPPPGPEEEPEPPEPPEEDDPRSGQLMSGDLDDDIPF